MKIGIMSDSHGNAGAIRRAVTVFNRENVDLVVHAGDYGAPPSAKELLSLNGEFVTVFGNMDMEKPGVAAAIREIIPQIQDPPLCRTIGARKIAVTHNLQDTQTNIPDDADVIIHGHLHRCEVRCDAGRMWINPGKTQHSVAILDTETMTCRIEAMTES